eukprot:357016_1
MSGDPQQPFVQQGPLEHAGALINNQGRKQNSHYKHQFPPFPWTHDQFKRLKLTAANLRRIILKYDIPCTDTVFKSCGQVDKYTIICNFYRNWQRRMNRHGADEDEEQEKQDQPSDNNHNTNRVPLSYSEQELNNLLSVFGEDDRNNRNNNNDNDNENNMVELDDNQQQIMQMINLNNNDNDNHNHNNRIELVMEEQRLDENND